MINITDKSQCSGCTACFSICPKQAISMQPDTLGFKYPKVDVNKCIECGLCEQVCAFNDEYITPNNFDQPVAYAARHKNTQEVKKSRSGGLFPALSDYILDRGGVVYGAGYDSSFRVRHKRALTKLERDEFRGSKYVQSDIGTVFLQVVQDLRNGLMVMFSGTPCQTAGLSNYLRLKKINIDNLFMCDIVCHGVPSPNIWFDYLKYIQHKEGKTLTNVNFRDKQKFGWSAHRESFEFDNTTLYPTTYSTIFFQHIMFRPSCGICHYTNLRRTGDVTLADFWGWNKTDPNINSDDIGVSLIFINTPKGQSLVSAIRENIELIPAKLEDCLQPNLQYPTKLHPQSVQFKKDYEVLGFEKTMKKYKMLGWRYKLKRTKSNLRSICGKAVRTFINRK